MRRGLPTFTLVGLPDRAVREARERVRAALLNSASTSQQRLTVNLARAREEGRPRLRPRDRRRGAGGHRAGAGEELRSCALYESSRLPGRCAAGGVPWPWPSARARPDARGSSCGGRRRRGGAGAGGRGRPGGEPQGHRPVAARGAAAARACPRPPRRRAATALDLADVRGQEDAKRALEIAAAGGHNLLMVGPPGAGKTMLARRLPGSCRRRSSRRRSRSPGSEGSPGSAAAALPRSDPSGRRTTRSRRRGWSAAGPRRGRERSRSPTGACSSWTSWPSPRPALDALRQPLGEGRVEIMRGQRTILFPARAMVVAATNPCPCGRPADACSCDAVLLGRYARRLSSPLLDRIDLVCRLGPVAPLELVSQAGAGSATRRARACPGRPAAPARAACRQRGALQRRHGRSPHPPVGPPRRPPSGAARRPAGAHAAERPRPRPRPARGAHDRRPRRSGAGGGTRSRRGARLPRRRNGGGGVSGACDGCLSRAFLIARLAPRIADVLQRPRQAGQSLFALGHEQLIAAVLGRPDEATLGWLDGFDADAARERVRRARCWAVCAHHGGYPEGLAQLTDAPAVLFGRGRRAALEEVGANPRSRSSARGVLRRTARRWPTRSAAPWGCAVFRS